MIEVVCAALIVALVAAAVFTGLSAAAHISGTQRHQSVAIELAQQDEQRLRGLTVQELVASASGGCASTAPLDGNGCYTQTIDNQTYTISSTAQFYSASNGSQSCTTSSVGSADYIATTSKITWQNTTSQPVEEHSLITPASGGQIVVAVQDNAQSPTTGLSGATVTITGPGTNTSTQTQTTDSSGCALFVAVTAGSYSVSATIPGPYVAYGGTTTQSVQLANNQTQTVTFNAARAATVNASFQTAVNGTASAIPFDTFSLAATSESAAQSFGTVGSYATPPSTVSSGAGLYPYSSGYNAYAGTCTSDDPGSSLDTPVTVTEGGTTPATVNVPSMLLGLTSSFTSPGGTTEVDDSNSSVTFAQGTGSSNGWTTQGSTPGDYNSAEHYSNVAGNAASYTFTGTSITWVTKLYSNHGYADVYIDGTDLAHNINTYSASTMYQYQAFTYVWPTSGTHTIKVVDDGGTPPGSSGSYIAIDAFIVGTYTPTQVPNTSASIAYTGTWGSYTNSSEYSGSEHNNGVAGSTASLTFTGTSVAWITSEWPDHGYADVYMDGTDVAPNVDTYAASATFQVEAFEENWTTSGTHTIKVYVDGRHDGSSTGNNVSIDEFIVANAQSSSTTSVTSWPGSWAMKTYDSCSTPVARPLPSNPVATTVSSQTVFPVPAPYGSSLQVCIANSGTNTNTGALPSGSTQLSNTDFTGRTIQSLTLPTSSTATGNSAVFANSGSCP